MDMADGSAATIAAIGICVRKPQLALIATPTVVQELMWGAKHWEPPARRALAEKALVSMLDWKIRPIDFIAAGHGICQSIGEKLAAQGYLPPEEVNDGLILGEAALCEARVLLTWDPHLLTIPADKLSLFLSEQQVGNVLVVSPARIRSLFGERS
jgi:hypothetical protein